MCVCVFESDIADTDVVCCSNLEGILYGVMFSNLGKQIWGSLWSRNSSSTGLWL